MQLGTLLTKRALAACGLAVAATLVPALHASASASAGPAGSPPATKLLSWYQKWEDQDRALMLETLEGLKGDEFTGDYNAFERACAQLVLPQAMAAGANPAPVASVQKPLVNVLNALTTIGENSNKLGEAYFRAQGKYSFWYELDVIQVNLRAMDAATKALGITLSALSD